MISLICEDGCLHTPKSVITDPLLIEHFTDNPILIRIYDAGDCDTIKWPNPNIENLRIALYDCRETGVLPHDIVSVILPDGTEFLIDE